MRTKVCRTLLAVVACLSCNLSAAAGYPTKPIRIIVMSTAASGPDILARLIGTRLTEAWGQQVVVDNRPGASGNTGAEIAARAGPDGHTLLMATSQAAIVAAMFDKLNYDLIKDFTPISLLASTPFIMVVNNAVPANSITELIALAKSKPAQLHYGSGGAGSPPHLAAEIFKSATGIDLVHVPYKGVTPALADTVGGQIQLTISVVPMVLPSVKAGRVRALGVTSLKRTSLAPELPSIAEFVPGYEVIGWYGLLAPAKTPGDIIAKLNGELTKALASTELQDRLSGMGAVALGTTADDFARHIRDEISKMRKAIKLSGARAE